MLDCANLLRNEASISATQCPNNWLKMHLLRSGMISAHDCKSCLRFLFLVEHALFWYWCCMIPHQLTSHCANRTCYRGNQSSWWNWQIELKSNSYIFPGTTTSSQGLLFQWYALLKLHFCWPPQHMNHMYVVCIFLLIIFLKQLASSWQNVCFTFTGQKK